METVTAASAFGGIQGVYRHASTATGTDMTFSVYVPPHAAGARLPGLLVDQGEADPFLAEQLKPDLLAAACAAAGIPLTLRMQPGYDHSYLFIATFMADHLAWHAERLQ